MKIRSKKWIKGRERQDSLPRVVLLPMDDEMACGRGTKESSAVHSQERILQRNLGSAEKLGPSISSLP